MKIFDSILETVGNTPLIRLNKISRHSQGQVVVKHEAYNPGGSIKDRIALNMINEAEKRGDLKPGGTIIECTSGNTGLGIAMTASVRGYRAILTMPDKVAVEKAQLLRAFGAEVFICPTAVEPDDPSSYYSVAKRLHSEIENSFYPNQYDNPDNPDAHYKSTGPEIWEDTDGKVTHFVAGCGTGGTISGIGKFLKEKNPDIQIIGADPVGSLYYDYFHSGKLGAAHTYKIEGVGEDIIPQAMDFDVIDDVRQCADRAAFTMARKMARQEAIFSGSSAGMVMEVALDVARNLSKDDLMVVLIPDTGERYLSKVYNEDWLRENQLLGSGISIDARGIIARKKPTGPLTTINANQNLRDAINIMREQDISQLPVERDGEIVGSLREGSIIPLLLEGEGAMNKSAAEAMEPPFPVVELDADADALFNLLSRQVPAVLVPINGGYDIITKWDVLTTVSGKL